MDPVPTLETARSRDRPTGGRLNAYRILLTRARDVTVVFVPPIPVLDETYEYLRSAGFRLLSETMTP